MEINLDIDSESSVQGVVAEQMNFDMSKQAKLFHMLSSSLYSNKLTSIVRELCSNAHDSHNMAGCLDKPFDLIAPTYEVPELVVKDYGVGLTAAMAKKTILCYLGSNKDTSNDFIGGWGIGSKSPFAYSKDYTVIVIKDGIRAEFLCWKDDHGLPCNALVSEQPTMEPNGVEMRVPVLATDVRTFTAAVREYVSWTNYNVTATINGDVVPRRIPADTLPVGSANMCLYDEGEGEIRLVYGGFSYDMTSCIDARHDQHPIWSKLLNSMNGGYDVALVVDQPNVIDFNMNREELEQTPRTRKFVMEIVEYLTTQATARVDAFDGQMKQLEIDGFAAQAAANDAARLETDVGAVRPVVKNLTRMAAFIDEALTSATNEDRIFAKAFRVFEHTFGYEFKGEMRRISHYSGVSRVYSAKFLVAPLTDQLIVFYSRVLNPDRASRKGLSAYESRHGRGVSVLSLFIKAESSDAALAQLAEHPDFLGMDLTKVTLIEIVVPLPASRAASTRAYKAMPPRIYDAVTKKYVKYSPVAMYVMTTTPDRPEYAVCRVGMSEQAVVKFAPTVDFVKKYKNGGFANLFTEDVFLANHYEDGLAKVIKLGGITDESYEHMEKIANRALRLCNWSNPEKIREPGEEICKALREAMDEFSEIRWALDKLPADMVVAYELDWWKELQDAAVVKIDRLAAACEILEFINLDRVSRKSTHPAAKTIIDALKIQEWI